MSFQLRDLRLKVFVALLLMFPNSSVQFSRTILCYQCEGDDHCDNPTPEGKWVKVCRTPFTACSKTGVAGDVTRGCYSGSKALCINKFVTPKVPIIEKNYGPTHGLTCYNAIVHKNVTEQIAKCVVELTGQDEKPDLPSASDGTLCVCSDKSLCNEGPSEDPYGTTETPRRDLNGAHSPAGQSTSTSDYKCNLKFIFGILTIAIIYNYSKGITSF